MTINLNPATLSKIASIVTRQRVKANAGFVFNPVENGGAGQIGRVTSVEGNWVNVEYPCWYVRKDGRLDHYTVRDSWHVVDVEPLTAQHHAQYDAALWQAWDKRQEGK